MGTKISVSLPDEDVAFLDHEVEAGRYSSRSAGLHAAIDRARREQLAAEYGEAFAEWHASADGPLWDSTSGDGLNEHAAR